MNTRDDLPPETTDRIAGSASARLIRYAASRMPPGLAERLEEEWIADLCQQDGALSRMRFALGCCWARQVIGRKPHLYGLRLSAAGHGHVHSINASFPQCCPDARPRFWSSSLCTSRRQLPSSMPSKYMSCRYQIRT